MFRINLPRESEITLENVSIKITRKKVKNINLRVYPAQREVCISAPRHLQLNTIRSFAESKIDWIQTKLSNYKAPIHPEKPKFITGEVHLYKAREWELCMSIKNAPPKIRLHEEQGILEMNVRPGSGSAKRTKVLKEWYRARLKEQIPELIEKWAGPMNVSVKEFGVKQMKTRWGSCNIRAGRIWLNLELAKRSPACLQYVVVHEMVHLLERLHNDRFYGFMDRFLPEWQNTEKELQGKID